MGRAVCRIEWPVPGRTIPVACQSIEVGIYRPGQASGSEPTQITSQKAARPESGGTTTLVFEHLPIGELIAKAVAYPGAEPGGVAQASGTTSLVTVAEVDVPFTITLDSTIEKIEVDPASCSLMVNQSAPFSATARNAAGDIVLAAVDWSSSAAGVASIDSTGAVVGTGAGDAQLTARVAGATTSGTATVAVQDIAPGVIVFRATARESSQASIAYALTQVNDPVVLVQHFGRLGCLRFSPDGQRLACEKEGFFAILDRQWATLRTTAVTESAAGPAWSPDGRWLYFQRNYGIRRMDTDTGDVQTVTSGPFDQSPAVSPDGDTLVWTRKYYGSRDTYTLYRSSLGNLPIEVANATALWEVDPQYATEQCGVVFLNGSQVLMMVDDDLWVADIGSSSRQQVGSLSYLQGFRVSHAGTHVAFHNYSSVYVMEVGAWRPTYVCGEPSGQDVTWAGLAWSPDGRYLALLDAPLSGRSQARVFLCRVGEGEEPFLAASVDVPTNARTRSSYDWLNQSIDWAP